MRVLLALLLLAGACARPVSLSSHSGSLALDATRQRLYAVNPDSDSVARIDLSGRSLTAELLLAGARPAVDPATGSFTPAVSPRALALSADGQRLYVTGQRSGKLYVLDPASGAVLNAVWVGAEPVGVLLSADGSAVFVACAQDATVVRLDARSLDVTARIPVAPKPWALARLPEGDLVVTHLTSGTVTRIDPTRATLLATWTIPPLAPRGDPRLAHGEVRGLYDAAVRPGTDELWVAHLLLGTDTAQPALNFESTAFPGLSVLTASGALDATLSTDAADLPGVDGAFADVVSGPQALAFTQDGRYALVADTHSEDVLVVDASQRLETSLLRPLPGHQPEGILLSGDERFAYVQERNSGDVAVLSVQRTPMGLTLAVEGAPIPTVESDPMTPSQRLGQHLFFSANSDEYPLTQNHWIACASCHLEGRSDAVTWRFAQGPRDTPSNAGGMLGTGFLFRTADRTRVQDYWHTIDLEQGGRFEPADPLLAPLLDALADYVNHALPLPVPPTLDAARVAAGQALFQRSDVGCAGCHTGTRFTDSGAGNPSLDLTGTLTLHDVGTCVTGTDHDDAPHLDEQGDARAACLFDTPSLNGLSDSAPYFHDGSAATLRDVFARTQGTMGNTASLSSDQLDDLVAYLLSL